MTRVRRRESARIGILLLPSFWGRDAVSWGCGGKEGCGRGNFCVQACKVSAGWKRGGCSVCENPRRRPADTECVGRARTGPNLLPAGMNPKISCVVKIRAANHTQSLAPNQRKQLRSTPAPGPTRAWQSDSEVSCLLQSVCASLIKQLSARSTTWEEEGRTAEARYQSSLVSTDPAT